MQDLVRSRLRSDRGTMLSRSQKFVMVQKFAGGQMRESGCPEHDKLYRKQEQNAKIVTSLLTLPSVLWLVLFFFYGFSENTHKINPKFNPATVSLNGRFVFCSGTKL